MDLLRSVGGRSAAKLLNFLDWRRRVRPRRTQKHIQTSFAPGSCKVVAQKVASSDHLQSHSQNEHQHQRTCTSLELSAPDKFITHRGGAAHIVIFLHASRSIEHLSAPWRGITGFLRWSCRSRVRPRWPTRDDVTELPLNFILYQLTVE